MNYNLSVTNPLVCDGLFETLIWVSRDGGRVHNRIMLRYFDKNFEIFLKSLETFRDINRPMTKEEQKHFKFMLEALIDAKNSAYDIGRR